MDFTLQAITIYALIAGVFLGLMLGYSIVRARYRAPLARLEARIEMSLENEAKLVSLHADSEQAKLDLLKRCAALEQTIESGETHHQAQVALLETSKRRFTEEFENLANRIFDAKQKVFTSSSQVAIDNSLAPLRRDLGDFRKQVESTYDKENAQRNQLMGRISELQKQTLQVSSEAASLANALRGDNKAQGNWGEFILEKLLEDSGLQQGREYVVQASLKDADGRRRNPDVVVHLPEGRDIVIDAKVSLVDYEKYHNTHEEIEQNEFLKKHIQSMRAHVRGLSAKNYEHLEGVNSLDFVLLFVPIESAFLLAQNQAPEMMKDAYDLGIIMVSPSTLMVTLRTIKNLWRTDDQNRNARLIADKAGGLYDQFVLFTESLDEVSKHLERSTVALETAQKRLLTGKGNLIRRTEDLKLLGAKAKKQLVSNVLPVEDASRDSNALDASEP